MPGLGDFREPGMAALDLVAGGPPAAHDRDPAPPGDRTEVVERLRDRVAASEVVQEVEVGIHGAEGGIGQVLAEELDVFPAPESPEALAHALGHELIAHEAAAREVRGQDERHSPVSRAEVDERRAGGRGEALEKFSNLSVWSEERARRKPDPVLLPARPGARAPRRQ